jgi:hypothetical protein
MRGYFSQLAKQSGIRFAVRGEKTRQADAKSSEIAPLDNEETKLIAPDLPEVKAAKSDKKAISKIHPGETEKRSAPNQLRSTTTKSSEPEKSKPDKIDPGNRNITLASENSVDIHTVETHMSPTEAPVKIREAEAQIYSTENTEPAEPQVIEQVVFKKSETPKTPEALVLHEFSEPRSSLSSATDAGEIYSEKTESPAPQVERRPPQKEYFKKTSELLETGKAGKMEIQQILLQEVQEWTAGGVPVSEEFENETTETGEKTVKLVELPPVGRESFVLRETQSANERENQELVEQNSDLLPPVEHKSFFLRDTQRNNESEKNELAEQNFNLSIGTISIVTEEAERPAEPEILSPKTKIENKTRETGRQFSRLSRHYL